MDRFIARMNIEHYRRQLAGTSDPAMREVIFRLLAEAVAALQRAEAAHAAEDHPEAARPVDQAEETRQILAGRKDGAAGDGGARRSGISMIVEQLQIEDGPAQRRSLRRKLLEEEDRFGALSRRMDLADGFIEDGARRVERLELLADSRTRDGDAALRHITNLENAREILEIFKSYRASLLDRAGRIDL